MNRNGQLGTFKQAGYVPGEVDAVRVYIAFSPAHESSPEFARLLSDGMARLRANGELNRILARYGIVDWY